MPETPVFSHGAVVAPHGLAAQAGQGVLAQGGNALEAMTAMAACLAVVCPHRNGLGGDGAWLVREPGGRVRALEACGPAGTRRRTGRDGEPVPARGPEACAHVAGAVGGWALALDLSRALGGRLPLGLLLADAIRHARDGCPVSVSEGRCRPADRDALHAAPNFATTFLADGAPPPAGALRRLPALAATLEHLAHAGLDDLYRGDVGREIAADLARLDAPVTRADLAAYGPRERRTLALRRRDAVLHALPPPAEGLAALLVLGILDRLAPRPAAFADSAAACHGLIAAAGRAAAICTRAVTDDDWPAEDPAAWLTPERLAREAARLDRTRAGAPPRRPPDTDGAAWMGAIDGRGLAVSCVQGIGAVYGAGCVLPATGILWQSRGTPGPPPAPGRRPVHALVPALACFDDGRVAVYGAAGGRGRIEAELQAQIFARYADLGLGPAAAVCAPRLLRGGAGPAEASAVAVEDGFDPACLRALAGMGYALAEAGASGASDAFGEAGMLVRHAGGRIEAAPDPRTDAAALGL